MRPARVLLVDDDFDFLLIWRMLLAHDDRFGRIEEAASGEDALDRLGADDLDVVVSDVRMGAVSGFDVLAAVQERHPRTPVVLTSGAEGVGAEAMARGAALFLAKSHTTTELFAETIWSVVGRSDSGASQARSPAVVPPASPALRRPDGRAQ